MMSLKVKQAKGFTLIEVMFALTIIAVALFSLSRVVGQTLNHSRYLDEKLIAAWVAQNVIADAELNPDDVKKGNLKGDAEMAGRKWYWEQRVEKTQDPDLKRVEVSVSSAQSRDSATLVTLVTLISQKLEGGIGNSDNDALQTTDTESP